MKGPITISNYEAWLLDRAEGRLSPEQEQALEAFLAAHPHLQADADLLTPCEWPAPEAPSLDWSHLKMPYSSPQELLFFKATEGSLSANEQAALDALLRHEDAAAEYARWQQAHVVPAELAFAKDALYRFGYQHPLSPATFPHYLCALTEGSLSPEQEAQLEAYAHTVEGGLRDVRLSRRLRLEAPKGIFYPHKKDLYQKDRPAALIWWRVAAAIAVLMVSVWYFTSPTEPVGIATQQKPAQGPAAPAAQGDTITQSAAAPASSTQAESPLEVAPALPAPMRSRPVEKRHLAPASTAAPEPHLAKADAPRPVTVPEAAPYETTLPDAALITSPDVHAEPHVAEADPTPHDARTAPPRPAAYQTLADIAEEKLARALALTEQERDALALALAKRAADRAAALLNAEVQHSRTRNDDGEVLTYSVRLGALKVSKTKSR